jgi:hypothetical protein
MNTIAEAYLLKIEWNWNIYIVTDLLSALLSNGSVHKPQQRDCFYVVRDTTIATQHRGKHISAAVSQHATIRTMWEVFCAVRANKQYNWVFCAVGAEVI